MCSIRINLLRAEGVQENDGLEQSLLDLETPGFQKHSNLPGSIIHLCDKNTGMQGGSKQWQGRSYAEELYFRGLERMRLKEPGAYM